MNEIVAVIMIGGQSQRMGGGVKSFIEFNNKSIFDKILERIQPQNKKIIVNCNTDEDKLLKYNLPIIQDLKKNYLGPLAGIHSAMHWMNQNEPTAKWLLTLPGDTPFIPKDLFFNFKKKITSKSKIILAKSDNKIHPIIGAWNISLFSNLEFEIDNGTRKIMSWAKNHLIEYVDYQVEGYDPFFNINTKEDIKLATIIENNFF